MRYGLRRQLIMVCILTVIIGLFAFSVKAQEVRPPDPAFMQAAISALQTQRNAALDNQAAAEARATVLSDQLAKANARITELQKLSEVKPKEDGK